MARMLPRGVQLRDILYSPCHVVGILKSSPINTLLRMSGSDAESSSK